MRENWEERGLDILLLSVVLGGVLTAGVLALFTRSGGPVIRLAGWVQLIAAAGCLLWFFRTQNVVSLWVIGVVFALTTILIIAAVALEENPDQDLPTQNQ